MIAVFMFGFCTAIAVILILGWILERSDKKMAAKPVEIRAPRRITDLIEFYDHLDYCNTSEGLDHLIRCYQLNVPVVSEAIPGDRFALSKKCSAVVDIACEDYNKIVPDPTVKYIVRDFGFGKTKYIGAYPYL